MLFARATSHALRALALLEAGGSPRTVLGIARELGIPGPYLAKIFQSLVQGGVLASVRGPRGGFRLARAPEKIGVREVLSLIEPGEPLGECFLGLAHCGRREPCPFHAAWGEARALLESRLASLTLADLQVLRKPGAD